MTQSGKTKAGDFPHVPPPTFGEVSGITFPGGEGLVKICNEVDVEGKATHSFLRPAVLLSKGMHPTQGLWKQNTSLKYKLLLLNWQFQSDILRANI